MSEITFELLLNEKCFQRLMDAVIESALDVTRETGLSINQLHWEFFDETTEYTPDGYIVGVKARLVPNPPEVVGVREWISVKDRLPEYKTPYDYVQVCNARENRYAIAWRDSPREYGKIWCFQADLLNDCFVTHWMPLTETPEVDDK